MAGNPKLGELIVYLCQKCGDLPSWGRTKLFKMLFYSDFGFYRETGSSITNADYSKLPNGPVPKAAYREIENMEVLGRLVQVPNWDGDVQEIRPLAKTHADLSLFTAQEISYVDGVIQKLGPLNAAQLSKMSHSEHGWLIANPDEVIPYCTAFGAPPKLSEAEVGYLRQVVLQQDAI